MVKLSRTYRNLISNVITQIIATLVGIIIPKLVILKYGSAVNGMVSSIGQFLMYAGLVEAGCGNAAVIALYKPLAEKSKEDISAFLSEASRKYTKSGIVYTLITFGIACVYPLAVKTQIEYSFAFSMTMILSMSGIIDYFVIGKYKVLLTADNKYYVINFSKGIASCILACGSIVLMLNGFSLLMVKALAVLTHLGEALFIKQYVKRKYPEYSFQSKRKVVLEQQGSALLHQVCMVITYNTDLIVLTLFLKGDSLLEISVYSVYALALSFAKNMMSVLYTGMSASFGELYAKNEIANLERRFNHYEILYYICLFTIYSCFVALILPFVRCYVGNVTDVNYVRIDVAVLFSIVGILSQLKDAYGTLVNGGCGAYKETRKYAVYEASINLFLSLILVKRLGIVGVLIGTAVSHLFMDFGVMRYGYKVILPQMKQKTISRLVRNFILFILLCVIEINCFMDINKWIDWIITAVIAMMINFSSVFLLNYLFEKNSLLEALPQGIQHIFRKIIRKDNR